MPHPYFGCAICRRRKVKCDEREGGCLKCESYGATCPGYPSRYDVLHRVHVPASHLQLRETATSSSWQRQSTLPDNEDVADHFSVPISRQFYHDPDTLALAMYYSNNCVDGSPMCSVEQMRSEGNGCLFAAIKVLSNIDIHRRWTTPEGSLEVTRSYNHAIQLLNLILSSPSELTRDSTLLATLIMSAIETKAAPTQSSVYWEAHTQGAAALLYNRGPNQVTSRFGSALFFQVSSQMLTSCILARRPVPADLQRLHEEVRPCVFDNNHPLWKYHGAMIRFANFYAVTASQDPKRVRPLLEKAFSIYGDILSVFANADSIWRYDRVPSTRYPEVLDHEYKYHTVLATQLWNGCRMAIILLCTVALGLSKDFGPPLAFDPGVELFLHSAKQTINQAALDSLASIPQGLALIVSKTGRQGQSGQSDICERGHTHHTPVFRENSVASLGLPYIHGCMIQWSVYFGAQSEHIEPYIRKGLWEILKGAGKRMNIVQWQILAKQLRPSIFGIIADEQTIQPRSSS